MSDIDDLTQFTLTGLESAVVADAAGDLGAVGVRVSVTVTARPEVVHVPSDPPRAHRIRPVKFRIEDGVLVLPGGGVGAVRLVANVGLGITGHLLYDVKFGAGSVGGDGVDFGDQNFTFAAPTSDTSVDLFTVERLAGKTPSGTILRMVPDHFRLDDDGNMIVSSNGIDISGPMPVVVSAAADWDMLINIPPVVAVGDTQAAARSAIGAGTSSLALGTSSSTAKAGDYQPTSENISDATETGRSVVTAANAAAARTAIGAAAGNDSRLTDTRTPTDGTVTTAKIVDANVSLTKLSAGVQTSLGKANTAYQAPAVVGAGATQADARTAIDAERITQFDVRNFGAVGNATHDDTTAIQAAIDAAGTAGGGRVILPKGEHKLTGILTMRSGVELSGTGPLSVLKPALPTGDVNRVIDNDWSTGSTGITLRNFKIDRSGAVLSHVMLFNGVDGLLVDGIEVSGGPATALGAGVLAISAIGPTTRLLSKNIRVVNNQFNDCGNYGVQVGFVDGCVIANNTAENSFREVFGVEPEADNTAKNVVISGNHVTASATINGSITGVIDVTEASGGTLQGVAVTGNVIRQINGGSTGQLGIYIVGESGGVTITGNSISGMDGPGIGVGNFDHHTQDIVITGNTVTDCAKSDNTKPGIYLRNGSRCTIVGNAVYGTNHAASVTEELSSSDNTIAFNSLRDTVPVVTLGVGTVVFGNKSVDGDSALHLGTSVTPSPSLILDGTGIRRTEYRNAGSKRWRMDVGGTETGSNSVGSDITFVSFDDTGTSAGNALTIKRSGRRVLAGGSLGVFRRASASNYTVVSSDCLVAITDTTAARTVTLPNAATEFEAGTILVIADESGGAGTNNITINPKGGSGQTIDGASSIVISKNYGLVQLYSTGTNWKVLHNRYAEALKTARTISGVSFDGSADIVVTTPKTVGPAYFPSNYVSGQYYYTSGFAAITTSVTLGNGVVRVLPWVVTDTVSVTRLFCEFTVAGDAASVFRMGIWNHDATTGKPGTLVLDAGSISTGSGNAGDVATGGTPGVYERTVSQTLTPGVYWVGGAVQGVTVTQPTMRTGTGTPTYLPCGTSLPTANSTNASASLSGVTGALGSLASAVLSATFPARIGFKVA